MCQHCAPTLSPTTHARTSPEHRHHVHVPPPRAPMCSNRVLAGLNRDSKCTRAHERIAKMSENFHEPLRTLSRYTRRHILHTLPLCLAHTQEQHNIASCNALALYTCIILPVREMRARARALVTSAVARIHIWEITGREGSSTQRVALCTLFFG